MGFVLTLVIIGGLIWALYVSKKSARVLFLKALEEGNCEMLLKAIDKGVNVNVQLSNGALPVVYAGLTGDIECVRLLIEKGADVKNGLVLHSAAINDDVEMAQLLIDSGADINGVDHLHDSRTPLMVAALFHNTAMTDFLKTHGADEMILDTNGKKWSDYLLDSAK